MQPGDPVWYALPANVVTFTDTVMTRVAVRRDVAARFVRATAHRVIIELEHPDEAPSAWGGRRTHARIAVHPYYVRPRDPAKT